MGLIAWNGAHRSSRRYGDRGIEPGVTAPVESVGGEGPAAGGRAGVRASRPTCSSSRHRRRAGIRAAAAGQPSEADMLSQLQQLGELRSAGVLTEQEFAAQKAKILGRLTRRSVLSSEGA